jgi:hypothetical protein
MKKEICGTFLAKCGTGFDVSFRDCPAKGGTDGHPTYRTLPMELWNCMAQYLKLASSGRVSVEPLS